MSTGRTNSSLDKGKENFIAKDRIKGYKHVARSKRGQSNTYELFIIRINERYIITEIDGAVCSR